MATARPCSGTLPLGPSAAGALSWELGTPGSVGYPTPTGGWGSGVVRVAASSQLHRQRGQAGPNTGSESSQVRGEAWAAHWPAETPAGGHPPGLPLGFIHPLWVTKPKVPLVWGHCRRFPCFRAVFLCSREMTHCGVGVGPHQETGASWSLSLCAQHPFPRSGPAREAGGLASAPRSASPAGPLGRVSLWREGPAASADMGRPGHSQARRRDGKRSPAGVWLQQAALHLEKVPAALPPWSFCWNLGDSPLLRPPPPPSSRSPAVLRQTPHWGRQ